MERLNRFPQGAPPSELLYRILELLFSEREAELVAQLPDQAVHGRRRGAGSGRCPTPRPPACSTSSPTAPSCSTSRTTAGARYVLPPPMAGLLRVLDDARARRPRPEGCWPSCSTSTSTSRRTSSRRCSPTARPSSAGSSCHEPALPPTAALHVLDYERASEVVASATAHRRRPLLLPPQDGAPGPGLRRAASTSA